ncbi:hypothetical protein MKW94_012722 [Papaver nudicaule]|uniref:Serine/threonine-protein kinase PRP4 homolog n=1 Tax=Papaver nudicaule TaxID=74823 RepID=A0AA41RU71_PAPNU|nr:hypothetical protein [Papaver nudicaule]
MAGDELDVRKKHHRSSEDGLEEEASKRRKHSHRKSSHRHHHRHHRHRSSKHDIEEEVEDLVSGNLPVADDKEEGEILDEEDGKKKLESDVESGEIDLEERNLGTNNDGADKLSGKKAKESRSNHNGFLEHSESAVDMLIDDGSARKSVDDEIDTPHDSRIEPVKHREKKVKRRSGDSPSRYGSPDRVNGNKEDTSNVGDKRSHRGSRSAKHGSTKDRVSESDARKNRGRSRSPVARKEAESDSRKYKNVDDSYISSEHVRDAEDDNSLTLKRHSDSIDGERNDLESVDKSVSPRRHKYKSSALSPSYDDYHDEAHVRSRSMSHDRFEDTSGRVKLHDSREKFKDESDHARVGKHGREDRPRSRERRSSYSRHSEREKRHGSRDIRENDRHGSRDIRENDRHGSRDIRENDRHGSRDIRENDRHGSRDIRENDRHGSRDIREKDRHDSRDIRDRERHGSRETRERDRGSEREKYDSHVARGRDRSRERGREWEGERQRNRNRDMESSRDGYKDIRHTRHEESDFRHESTGLKDSEVGQEKLQSDAEKQEDDVELKLLEEEEDVDRIKEESRKRRQAILEKYKKQQLQQVQPQSEVSDKEQNASPHTDKLPEKSSLPTKTAISVVPNLPRSTNDDSDADGTDPIFSVGKSPAQNGTSISEKTQGAGGLGDGTPKSERSTDMFSDDIFGESPAGGRKMGKGDGLQVEKSGLNDNWDDAEGYYSYRFGEILDGRYEVTAAHGKGVFSTVVRAKDLKAGKDDPEEVAIKIIRNNDTMYKAGQEELIILKKLAGADPEDRRHCVRFLSSFKYRNHLCLVFESLHMNLREVLKKFGRNIGLKLTAVRAYAKQLFIALKHLRNCGVLHSDIKPDNMLVNEAKNVLKLCDFGNAMFAGKNEITPYLVSRFYRAPEIILGLSYDHPMDIWSVGCCLYELFSGKVLFPGPSNNDMLRLHMELKGPFPKKMLRKGAFTDQHFDQDFNFHATEEDPVTKKAIKRILVNIRPKDIGTIIRSSPGEDPKMLANFKDLLERIFVLDPDKRLTVAQALAHPFISGK